MNGLNFLGILLHFSQKWIKWILARAHRVQQTALEIHKRVGHANHAQVQVMHRGHFAFNSRNNPGNKQGPKKEEPNNRQPVKIRAVFFA